jgi:hypothetical protein
LSNSNKPWWSPIVHFLAHTVVGTIIFVIIAGAAVSLSLLVHYLESLNVSAFSITVITAVEYVILIFDATLFVVHLFITGINAVKEMLK